MYAIQMWVFICAQSILRLLGLDFHAAAAKHHNYITIQSVYKLPPIMIDVLPYRPSM